MLETINNFVLLITDPFLGWLLLLPRDVALILVSCGTGAILAFSRKWTTNQDLLARCQADKKRIKVLIKEAKVRKDKAAIVRHRATMSGVALRLMKAEGMPLLVSIVPIALLATWCFGRIGNYPPEAGETVEYHAYLPAAAIGSVAHIAPVDGLDADAWIAVVEPTPGLAPAGQEGQATWTFRGEGSAEPYAFTIRVGGADHHDALRVGQRKYTGPYKFFHHEGSKVTASEWVYRPYWPFGVLRTPWPTFNLFVPPWMLGYLIIAIPFVTVFKAAFKIS